MGLHSLAHGFNFLLLVKLPQINESYMLWDFHGFFCGGPLLTSTFPGYQFRTEGLGG